ncbi:hypothetical protein WJX72_006432 [[Myrmecia] bisecta]|uniref:Uncharacterized protein n=1 Tax=[Myrmecia] bisecta TaxID=41462 RepID=A0AAW1Q2B6_9CHLO
MQWRPSAQLPCIEPGRSDHETGRPAGKPHTGPPVTTYQRAAAGVESFWKGTGASLALPIGSAKTNRADQKAHIQLGTKEPFAAQLIEGPKPPRIRGITGYTGKQPTPEQHREPPPRDDPSHLTAINAYDALKPRCYGIVGYTGHQPTPQAAGMLAHILSEAIELKRRSSVLPMEALAKSASASPRNQCLTQAGMTRPEQRRAVTRRQQPFIGAGELDSYGLPLQSYQQTSHRYTCYGGTTNETEKGKR